jgi:hypothetical protein
MFNSRTLIRFFISSVLLLFLFLLPGIPRAFATTFGVSIQASCSTQADFGASQDLSYDSSAPGASSPLNCASAGSAADFYGEGDDAATSALGSANASVAIGAAGVELSTAASSTPLIDGAIARANVDASWWDTLTITGPFANGDPVQFLITAGIAGSMTSVGETDGSVSYNVTWGQANGLSFSDDGSSQLADTKSEVVTFDVGDQVTIGGQIFSAATAVAGNTIDDTEILSSENDVLAGDTFSLFITPITPGASYISASGTDYAPSVPEPSSLLLVATGLALTGLYGRQHQSRFHSVRLGSTGGKP